MPRVRVICSLETFCDTNDLDTMWKVMRPELERRLGRRNYVCLPHLTDGNCYGVGSVFLKVQQTGMWCCYKCTFLPLGPIEALIKDESTNDHWHTKHPSLYSTSSQMGSTYFFRIILQDPMGHKELKLNVDSVHARPMPLGMNPVNSIVFDCSTNSELSKTNEIYLVTSVKEVDRLELTGTIGARTRVYHIIHRYPLFFKYGKYKIDREGRVISKMKCSPSTKRSTWLKMNETENIDDVPRPDWEHFSYEEHQDWTSC